MKSLNELLDAIKERRNLETDSALAAALGVKRQTVSNWRQGRNTPDAVACATIAGLSGEPLARVIGLAGEQRAISQEEKAVWRKLAASVGVALIAVLATLPSVAHAATGAIHAAQTASPLLGEAVTLCIMRNKRRVRRLVLRTLRVWRYYWSLLRLALDRLLQGSRDDSQAMEAV